MLNVAMIPRPPKSPTRTPAPAWMRRTVSAAAAASVAPNYLAAARARTVRRGRRRAPARANHSSQSWGVCANSGVGDPLRTDRNCTAFVAP
eukprot:4178081-Pyramimonas_sp.AAC.1